MKQHFMRYKNEYISIGILMISTLAILTFLLQLWKMSPSVPLVYSGSDDINSVVNAKMFSQQTWNFTSDRLGASLGTQFYDFAANMLHNFDSFLLKIFSVITGNAGLAVNLDYLSTFFLIALISYFVMRELKITNWISICGSLVFSFMPYIFFRGILHLVLSAYYFIPLSILLCFWIFERDDVLVFNKQFFKNKRNWFSILFIILIANNGIAYYQFFTCFLLIITAISKVIKTKDFKVLLKSGFVIVGIVLFMLISMIPAVIYYYQNGINTEVMSREGIGNCEKFALKIIQLFLPVDDHGISILGKVINEYNDGSFYINENMSSYLGIIGICGFLLLIISLFLKKEGKLNDRLSFLAEMNISMVLLGAVGGFSAVFAVLVSNKIRAYNRISIYIAYVCILAIAFILDAIYKKHKKNYIVIIASVVTLLCIWEQFPTNRIPDYDTINYNFKSDADFVATIEDKVGKDALIFQMPYHEYPEGDQVNEMTDYQLFTGYIHSDTLKWSYGAIKGSDGANWNESIYALPAEKMIPILQDAGFSGIYIDRRAYEANELEELESKLTSVLGCIPISSDNDYLSFFEIKEGFK